MSKARDDALAIWHAGVDAVLPERLLPRAVAVDGGKLSFGSQVVDLDRVGRIAVVGAGKAGDGMARALVAALGERVLAEKRVAGVVAVPGDEEEMVGDVCLVGTCAQRDNRPTERGVIVAEEVLHIAQSLGEDDLLIALFSGGGSALLPAPAAGISLEDKIATTALLQEAGASIPEMNAVRKHLSRIKGGGLAAACRARIVSLLISDVVDDRIDVIASGPTAPDRSRFVDAVVVLERHGIAGRVPGPVADRLDAGARGLLPENPVESRDRVTHLVIGRNADALTGAAAEARARDYSVVDLSTDHQQETAAAASTLAGLALHIRDHGRPVEPPVVIVSGGETVVRLPEDHGTGGRNQELALALLAGLGPTGLRGITAVCGGTDGEDGPTDAAGAFVDLEVFERCVALGLDPITSLSRHDSHPFFDALGALVRTGRTGTNVADLRVIVVSGGSA